MYEQTQATQVYCFRCSTYFYFCRFEIIPRHYSGYVWRISQGYQSFSDNHYVFRHDVRACLRWVSRGADGYPGLYRPTARQL